MMDDRAARKARALKARDDPAHHAIEAVRFWRAIANTREDQPLPRDLRAALKKMATQLYGLANDRETKPKYLAPKIAQAVGLPGRVIGIYREATDSMIYGALRHFETERDDRPRGKVDADLAARAGWDRKARTSPETIRTWARKTKVAKKS
jgi:hypothetical protein